MQALTSLLTGLVFGLGLSISGMIDPSKVLGFLDVFGNWDPTLLVVMGSTLIVVATGFTVILKRPKPVFADVFALPTRKDLDSKLIFGAILFGIGWGLAGFCPGPAIAGLALLKTETVLFVLSMIAGMLIHSKTT